MSQEANTATEGPLDFLDDPRYSHSENPANVVTPGSIGQVPADQEEFYESIRQGNQFSGVPAEGSYRTPGSRPSPTQASFSPQDEFSTLSMTSSAKKLSTRMVTLPMPLLLFLTSVNGLDLSVSQIEFVKKYCLISVQQIVRVCSVPLTTLLHKFELQDLLSDSNMTALFRLVSFSHYIVKFGPHVDNGTSFNLSLLPIVAKDHDKFLKHINMPDLWAYSQSCVDRFQKFQTMVYKEMKRGGTVKSETSAQSAFGNLPTYHEIAAGVDKTKPAGQKSKSSK